MRPTIHVLTGCTAVGKTELALRWAETHDAEIVSCDSLLFYRGMDIGTAKPTKAELARVPHHLIDVSPVSGQMNVTTYVAMARAAVAEILARARRVLVVGGSGFYLKAFFAAVADAVEVPPELRTELRERLAGAGGLESLVAELRGLNPGGLGALDVQNPRRVLRALERCRASGRTLAELKAEFEALPSAFSDYVVELTELERNPSELDARIESRVAMMLQQGLVEEVRVLLAGGLRENPSAASAIGYRETIKFVDGAMPQGELAGEIAKNTRALVRKQRTWFKTQLPVHRRVDAGVATIDSLFGG